MILVSGRLNGESRTIVQFMYKSMNWFSSSITCNPPTVGWGDGRRNGFNYDLGANPSEFLTDDLILTARIDEDSFPPPSQPSLPQAKLNRYDRSG